MDGRSWGIDGKRNYNSGFLDLEDTDKIRLLFKAESRESIQLHKLVTIQHLMWRHKLSNVMVNCSETRQNIMKQSLVQPCSITGTFYKDVWGETSGRIVWKYGLERIKSRGRKIYSEVITSLMFKKCQRHHQAEQRTTKSEGPDPYQAAKCDQKVYQFAFHMSRCCYQARTHTHTVPWHCLLKPVCALTHSVNTHTCTKSKSEEQSHCCGVSGCQRGVPVSNDGTLLPRSCSNEQTWKRLICTRFVDERLWSQ